MATPKDPLFQYRWFLRRVLPDRHGQLCRIVAAGDTGAQQHTTSGVFGQWRGQIVVEFLDGSRVTTTRVAIKRLRTARGAGRWS